MSDAALSVLVLAWDEAAPAVRTVVDAAPAVGSLLVLLPPQPPAPPKVIPPPSPAPPEAEAPAPVVAGALAATTGTTATVAEPVSLDGTVTTHFTSLELTTASPPAVPPRALVPAEAPAALLPPALTPAAQQPAKAAAPRPVAPPAVRLLHLVDNPLTLLEHTGSFRVPTAPYLGATPTAPVQAELATPTAPTALPIPTPALQQAPAPEEPGSLSPLELAPIELTAPLGLAEVAEPTTTAAAPEPLSASAEAPATAEKAAGNEATAEAAATDEQVPALADAAFRAEEILDPDPMQELQAAPLSPAAATPADSPVLRDALPQAHGPFGLRIPERLPVLDDPTPSARTPEPDGEEPLPDEPTPVAAPYSAPDLNTQVIRYARQAVQTALAEGPFGTIYAPAWPTWLAALELRQRSGRPLVLHLAALAAGRQPADTAAGWPAEIQRQALRQADLVLVETYSLARRLRRELGLDTKLVRVVPAGDASAIARALRRAHRP